MDSSLIRYNDVDYGGAREMFLKTSFSDEEISRHEREILDDQLETEDLFAWRKEFLEKSASNVRISVVEQTARVRGHEPVLKESDDKDEQKMYDKVTKKYEKARKRTDKEAGKRRRAYQSMYGAFRPMRVNQISSKPQFDVLANAAYQIDYALLFQASGEKERVALRKMYSNLQLSCELEASYQNQLLAYDLILKDEEIMNDPDMLAETQRRIGLLEQQRELVHQRVDDLSGIIRHVTKDSLIYDKGLSDRGRDMTLVKKFYGENFRRRYENSQDVIAVQQRDYIKGLGSSKSLDVRREVKSGKERQEIEEWARSYYDDLNAFSVENYAAMENRELMQRMRELQELGTIAGQMRVLGSRQLGTASTEESGKTILSAYCNTGAEEVLMAYRLKMAELCARKARILWYIEALRLKKLSPGDINPDDRWEPYCSESWQLYEPLERMLAQCSESLHMYLELYRSQKAQM